MRTYRDWTLNAKVIVPVGVTLLLVAGIAAVFISQQRMQQVRGQAVRRSSRRSPSRSTRRATTS